MVRLPFKGKTVRGITQPKDIQCAEAMDADEYATMLRPIPPPLGPHDKELSSPKC